VDRVIFANILVGRLYARGIAMNGEVKLCPFCQQSFVLQKYLKNHITSKHKAEKEFD